MPFAEDLAPFFADFGDAGTLAGQPVRVIFDVPTEQQLGGMGVLSSVPQVQIATASVPSGVEGATLVIPQGTYTVREHVADGTGLSLLMLRGSA
ncbi:MAG: hypothetical protein IPM99_18795 [Rubrivivax sp.]|nr:hypothetical protein [Rubrivivax sp.]